MAETRTAFVSGAGKNIGRAVAQALARRGCRVVINGASDRAICDRVAGEVKEAGGEALVLMGDVGDPKTVRGLAEAALGRFGRIDILVNNAALRPHKPFLEMSDDDWHGVLAVDLHSSVYLSRAFLPGMVDSNWGRIVNMTGMNAIMGYAGRAHVSTAKHGLWGLTKALAREFGGKGVTVNAISPGPIHPDEGLPVSDHLLETVARVPLNRAGTAAEVAAVCAMLCSDDGGYVNGQMIAVNGGGTM